MGVTHGQLEQLRRHHLLCLLEVGDEVASNVLVPGGNQCVGNAVLPARSPSPSNAMHVGINLRSTVEIDHSLDVRHVKPSRCDFSGYQDRHLSICQRQALSKQVGVRSYLSLLEVTEDLVALYLLLVTVNGASGIVGAAKVLCEHFAGGLL